MMRTPTSRPVFLNFARIRFPVGAVASIGHRISGVVLACSLPFVFFALDRSMGSEGEFAYLIDVLRSPFGRMALVLLAWACTHHLFAGIRHLLMDVGVGASLTMARRTAYATLGTAAAIAAAAAVFA
ncbi:MAG: succinate dehydrogenase, cytochrome b556 subunit [Gammaproteobacteria bacterium]|nr:succinate dehydrogenase, cytochrome b556 subunit [Gammaproteobacteria bacterium]HMM73831.1 succinate dehydrogenase, cytochrome b556 subunit [Rhodocyclaceae bacterium]